MFLLLFFIIIHNFYNTSFAIDHKGIESVPVFRLIFFLEMRAFLLKWLMGARY
jgi:hypothetical protein